MSYATFWMIMLGLMKECKVRGITYGDGRETMEVDMEKLKFIIDHLGLDHDDLREQLFGNDVEWSIRNAAKEYAMKLAGFNDC